LRRLSAFSSNLAQNAFRHYIAGMSWLTKQEQLVLAVILGLLLTGMLVKFYREAHPTATATLAVQPAKP